MSKKLLKVGLGMKVLVHLKIQMVSTRQLSMLRKNVLQKLKFGDFYLKINPVDQSTQSTQSTKDIYCGLTDNKDYYLSDNTN